MRGQITLLTVEKVIILAEFQDFINGMTKQAAAKFPEQFNIS